MLFIEIGCPFSGYKDFKRYDLCGICVQHRDKFGKLPFYQRFVALEKPLFLPLSILLQTLKAQEASIYVVDSPSVKACHNTRITRHKVFDRFAKCGKSTMGWLFGPKPHLIMNHQGEMMAIKMTPGRS